MVQTLTFQNSLLPSIQHLVKALDLSYLQAVTVDILTNLENAVYIRTLGLDQTVYHLVQSLAVLILPRPTIIQQLQQMMDHVYHTVHVTHGATILPTANQFLTIAPHLSNPLEHVREERLPVQTEL